MVVGGYDDDLKKSVEYFIDGAWEDHPAELEFGRWAYGMPNYIPQDMVRKGGGYFSKCSIIFMLPGSRLALMSNNCNICLIRGFIYCLKNFSMTNTT